MILALIKLSTAYNSPFTCTTEFTIDINPLQTFNLPFNIFPRLIFILIPECIGFKNAFQL